MSTEAIRDALAELVRLHDMMRDFSGREPDPIEWAHAWAAARAALAQRR